ncbi:MAG: hypothetical protein BWX64_00455 [Acidobacteria bacterium ADurb.Bin051]|mgnify:CR=1 FL=1|jgi:hypothetical protein|nr:MAG: hypothetical protein BWX64_00455 [Acidobacteria bacterium ADurb.Bin051]
MPEFRILKPIHVTVEKSTIDIAKTRAAISAAINAALKLKQKVRPVGCYIYVAKSLKRRGKVIPVYVGQTKKGFETECLTLDTRKKVESYLKSHKNDELFLYLVAHPVAKGEANKTSINELEKFLIARAAEVNPNVKNHQGTKPTPWSIHGVLGGGRGRRSEAAKQVAEMLNLAPPSEKKATKPVPEE